MVETRVRPRTGVMAGFALITVSAIVGVVLSVTTKATCWRILMRLVLVAVSTLGLKVLADQ